MKKINDFEQAKQISVNPTFDLTYQDGLLHTLFNDPSFAKEFINSLDVLDAKTKPVIFQTEYNQVLFDFLKESSTKYGTIPSQGQVVTYLEQKFDEEQVKINVKNYERLMALQIHDADFYKTNINQYLQTVYITNNFVHMHSEWSQKGLLATIPHLKKIANGVDDLDLGQSSTRRLSSYLDNMDSKTQEEMESGYLPIGIPKIDEALNGGLPLGGLITFLGGNNAGKTTTMISLPGASAIRRGEKVLHIPLDGKKDEAVNKYLSCLTGIELTRIYKPYLLSEEEKRKIRKTVETLDANLLLWSPKDTVMKAERILAKVESLQKQFNASTIIVDYIGVLGTYEKVSSLREVNVITHRMFANYAKKAHVRVITAVQANRAGQAMLQGEVLRDQTANTVLRSTNMAESDDIGRVSEVIITINITDAEVQQCRARFYLEKNREGKKHVIQGLYTDFSRSTVNTGKYFDPDVPVSVQEALDGGETGSGELAGNDREAMMKKMKGTLREYGTNITIANEIKGKLEFTEDEAVQKNLNDQLNNANKNIVVLRDRALSYVPFLFKGEQLSDESLELYRSQAKDSKKDKASAKAALEAAETVQILEFYHKHKVKK